MNEQKTKKLVSQIRDMCDQLERLAGARVWTKHGDIPVGVPFTNPSGRGLSDIVFVKLEGGILLNFGSGARHVGSTVRVPLSVLSGDVYVEFTDFPPAVGSKND